MKTATSRSTLRVWLLCLLTFACFFSNHENSNVTTRLALTLSILDRREASIDQMAPYTIDKGQFEGHFYADKAPGLSLLALPICAVFELFTTVPAHPIRDDNRDYYVPQFALLSYVVLLGVIGTIVATSAALLFRWCGRRGASRAASSFAALSYAFGTLVLPWSTTLFGHAAAGALLLTGFVLLSELGTERSDGGRTSPVIGALGGLSLGAAFLIELTSGPAVAIVAACCAVEALVRGRRWTELFLFYGAAALGLAIPIGVLLGYNAWAFGSALHLGYANVSDFPGMNEGFFGISRPVRWVAASLIYGWYRGLLPLDPLLLLVPFGVLSGLLKPQWRTVSVAASVVFLWYWLMNAGYFYWHGGYSIGPRHLVPSLALLSVPLAMLWDRSTRVLRSVYVAMLTASAAWMIVCTAISTDFPEWQKRPLQDIVLPSIQQGDFPRLALDAFGLHGWVGFVPIVIVWVIFGAPLWADLGRSIITPAPRVERLTAG